MLVAAMISSLSATCAFGDSGEAAAEPAAVADSEETAAEPATVADSEETAAVGVENKVVGISTLPATSLTSALVLQGIVDGAKDKGWDVQEAPSDDVEGQISKTETLIEAGVGVLAVGAIDNDALAPVIGKAMEKGIRIFDTYNLPEGYKDIACSYDHYQMGLLSGKGAGEYAKEHWPDEEIEALVFTSTTSEFWISRSNGVVDGIKESGAKINVVAVEEAWETEEALKVTESVLQAHPDLRMVIAINDAASLGAYTAMVNNGNTDGDKYFVGAIDLVPQMLKYMSQENTIFKSGVYLDLYQQSYDGTQLAIDMAESGKGEYTEIPVGFDYVEADNKEQIQKYTDLFASYGF